MKLRTALLLFAALTLSACGNPFDEIENEVDEQVEDTTGIDADEDSVADVQLTFADAATAPSPAVGDGFSATNGERTILMGKWITFTGFNDDRDSYPQLTGWLYDELGVGKTIELSEEAQTDQSGGVIIYTLDEETSWISRGGTVTVESASPLKLKFNDVKMTPYTNSLGEFIVNGTGAW